MKALSMQKGMNENNLPYICIPLTGKTTEEIKAEVSKVVEKKPDLLEWRADFFEHIDQADKVLAAIEEISLLAKGIPLLFTIRSEREGGQIIPITEQGILELLMKVCDSPFVEIIDYEVMNHPNHVKLLKEACEKNGKQLLLSFHNFHSTPSKAELFKILCRMELQGAQIAKVAVMPNSKQDVIQLLEVTKEACDALTIPVVMMSMGELGAISRIIGWYYGSAITFAVGNKSSAPGQVPIDTLRQLIDGIKGNPIQ